MKKILTLVVILALIFVVACQPQPEPKPKIMCPDGTIVDDAELCPKPEVIETCDDGILNQDETNLDCGGVCGGYWYDNRCNAAPPPIPPTPEIKEPEPEPAGISAELQALIDKSEKYDNFKYKYKGDPYPTKIYQISVWKNKFKIVLPDTEENQFDLPFDTVYLDTKEKTAKGYCEWDSAYQCTSTEAVAVNFEDYNFKTPYQWTKEIKAGDIEGGEMVFRRNTQRVPFTFEGKNSVMWIDDFYGLPIKIVVGLDNRGIEIETTVTYSYQDLRANSVFEEDVIPPEPESDG